MAGMTRSNGRGGDLRLWFRSRGWRRKYGIASKSELDATIFGRSFGWSTFGPPTNDPWSRCLTDPLRNSSGHKHPSRAVRCCLGPTSSSFSALKVRMLTTGGLTTRRARNRRPACGARRIKRSDKRRRSISTSRYMRVLTNGSENRRRWNRRCWTWLCRACRPRP